MEREIRVGKLKMGGNNPVIVQSMCVSRLEDTESIINEINNLAAAGAGLIRFSVRNMIEASLISRVVEGTDVPLCADIHFDYRLAVEAIKNGIHKVRINPGNIGSAEGVSRVVEAAKSYGVPVRIGVNGGSLDRNIYRKPEARNMVDSALSHIRLLEKENFENIVVSLKSSNVHTTIEANRLFAKERDYPLHLGVTEAGYGLSGIIKSSIAIGSLLLEGIGSTIRVSLTGDPGDEIDAGYRILSSIGKSESGIHMVSCPTCGRTDRSIDLKEYAEKIELELNRNFKKRLADAKENIDVAVMGCEVNGPGEACDADVGIAGTGKGNFLLFKKGERISKIDEAQVLPEVNRAVDDILKERGI